MRNEAYSDVAKSATEPAAPEPLAVVSLATAWFVVAAGAVVLIGWACDVEVLKRIRPSFTAMNPLSAVCLMLSGIAILAARGRCSRTALASASTIFLLALTKAADIAWGGLPVDKLLFASRLSDGSGLPNAMAPNTTAAFFLVALGLLFRHGTRRSLSLISQAIGASVLVISMFALIGYALGINHLHSVGPFIPMAVHTGVGLAVVSVGIMSLTPHCGLMLLLRDRGSAGAMARTILPLAILIPVAVGAMRLWGQKSGYYGTEAGVALQVIANVLVTSLLLTSSIFALYRSNRIRLYREQDLARSEFRYRLAESVAQVGHWRMNVPSLEVSWSDEVFRISGIAKEAGVPSAAEILEIYHQEDRRGVRDSMRQALREGRNWEYVVRVCRPDGQIRHVSSHGVCEHDESGKLTGVFGVFADITDLEVARRRAEQATGAKAVFLANMSHEIRTPLNGVMGFAELLLASSLNTQQKRHADLIYDSAQTLLKLLNDILDVSKIDAGQFEIAQEPFDLRHQLRQCVRLMDAMAQSKGLVLTLTVDPDLPKNIVGDGLRLRQVLLNLLGNAIKFTTRGSVTVNAAAAVSDSGATMLAISVRDTGVGIPKDRQAAVFDEFVQAEDSTARRFGGSGLGLTISRRLVALMGGDIKLASREGHGTQVTVTLPLQAVLHPLDQFSGSQDSPAAISRPDSAYQGSRTILLAEDLDINQELITAMLGRMGYKVDLAADGQEAIRLAGRLLEQPDAYGLILMDIQMPVVDGIDATKAIRALGGRAAQIPIVALTANAYASDIEECRQAGMVDHLAKPVSMAALGAAVTHWMSVESTTERRGLIQLNLESLKDKFIQRKVEYGARLSELQHSFDAAGTDARKAIIAEASTIAHNLAGTAAMFGDVVLGKVAALAEDAMERESENGLQGIDALLKELRRAA